MPTTKTGKGSTYRVTTYPTLNKLELGPAASQVVAEAKLEGGVAHLIDLKLLTGDYVQISCKDGFPPAVMVVHDSALRELVEDGGPNAYLEVADSD
jgi:hypothetical protein